MRDLRDVEVSTDSAADIEEFELALKDFQTYTGDPIERIEQTLTRSPEFVLGHVFRAINYCLTSERRFMDAAVASLAAAQALNGSANQREKMLIRATKQLVEGDWDGAGKVFDAVLTEYPRDIFVLQAAHLLDFFRGDALNLRNRPARALPDWSESMPGYSYIHGLYAFGLEEMNQYDEAEHHGRKALELDRVDAWAVHAVVHVMEMQGRAGEGIQFLESRHADWAPENSLAHHNWWHLGLLYLEQHDDQRVLQILDDHIAEGGDFSLSLVDVTAMLWRLQLIGIDLGTRMDQVARIWAEKMDEVGFYGFNDFHAAMAFAGSGETGLLGEVEAGLVATSAANDRATSTTTSQVSLPLVRALIAMQEDRCGDAVQYMLDVRDVAHRFGGSHAQRDVISLTLLAAARRNGEERLVQHLMNERDMAKPGGVLAARVIEKAA